MKNGGKNKSVALQFVVQYIYICNIQKNLYIAYIFELIVI